MVGDAQLVSALRRQLGELAYDSTALTAEAAPLVAALLADLVKATDSYRALKVQAGDAGQASQTLQYQVGACRASLRSVVRRGSVLSGLSPPAAACATSPCGQSVAAAN